MRETRMKSRTTRRVARTTQPGISDPAVKAVFNSYAPAIRPELLALRALILDTAATTPGVGKLEETLKWGQPSYLTTQTKAGSTLRIDAVKSDPARYAMFFHCQTNLAETFRELYPKELILEGNRSIVLRVGDILPEQPLRHCIALALTYHLHRRKTVRPGSRKAS